MKINKEADLFIISGKQNKQGEPRENPSTKSCRETIGNKPKRGWKRVKSMETMDNKGFKLKKRKLDGRGL